MSKFLINIILFSLVIIVVLSSLSLISDAGLKITDHDNYVVWNDIYKGDINAEILILGSSRAWVDVSTRIIDSVLGANSYNLGVDGHNFRMQNCIYEVYLKNNNKPELIIHCLDITTLSRQIELYNLEQTIPYLKDSIVSITTKKFIGYEWFDYYNPFTKYFTRHENLRIGLLEYFRLYINKSTKYKGYRNNVIHWDGKLDVFIKNNPQGLRIDIDKEVFHSFDQYLAKNCKNNIETVLVFPPELKEAQIFIINRDSIINIYKSLSQKHNLRLIDFSNDSICLSRKYFYNSSHLNKIGSEIFTLKLVSLLQE